MKGDDECVTCVSGDCVMGESGESVVGESGESVMGESLLPLASPSFCLLATGDSSLSPATMNSEVVHRKML